MTAPTRRPYGSFVDLAVGLVMTVLLLPLASLAITMAAYFELSNHTCGASYGGCYTPYVTWGFQVAAGGSALAILGSLLWVSIGASKGRVVGYVPVLGALLIIATFLLGGEIATWA
ncbi:hypothetical protein ACWF82_12085 [Nocardia sp. NPDC055053]